MSEPSAKEAPLAKPTLEASLVRRELRSLRLPLALMVLSGVSLVPALLGAGDLYSIGSGLIAVTGLILGAVRFTDAPLLRGQPSKVELEAEFLHVGGRRLRRKALTQGALQPVADGVELQLRSERWREPTVLHFRDAAEAQSLLTQLGLDAEMRTAHFVAQSEWLGKRWFVPSVIAGSLLMIAVMLQWVAAGWPAPQLLVLVVGFFGLLALSAAVPVVCSVGLDGLSVRRLGKTEFIPWAQITRVTPFRGRSVVMEAGGIEIEVRGRKAPLRLPMATDSIAADTPERLAARIEQARAASAAHGAPLTLSGSQAERVRAAKAVLEGEAGYRQGHIAPEAVSALVLDPNAASEDRVAAAHALAESKAGRAKVRIAVSTTAERSLREALGSALSKAQEREFESDEAEATEAEAVQGQRRG